MRASTPALIQGKLQNHMAKTLVKRDEKREPDAEDQQRDDEVTVGEDGSCLWGNLHLSVIESCVVVLKRTKTIIGEPRRVCNPIA